MIEMIFEFTLIVYLISLNLLMAWYIGDYEHTGRNGWRRIPAGVRLAYDIWHLWFNRWIALQKRKNNRT